MTTHWDGCWQERTHHACAVAEIERLQAQVHARDGIIADLSMWVNGVLAVLDRSDIPAEVHAELARLRRENEEGNA